MLGPEFLDDLVICGAFGSFGLDGVPFLRLIDRLVAERVVLRDGLPLLRYRAERKSGGQLFGLLYVLPEGFQSVRRHRLWLNVGPHPPRLIRIQVILRRIANKHGESLWI